MSWHTIRASAHDHPNVVEGEEVIPGGPSRAWIEDVRDEYGEESPYYVARVEARFPTSSSDSLMRSGWVERSMAALEDAPPGAEDFHADGAPWTVGVDVARLGSDKTAVAIRRGPVVHEIRTWGQVDTMGTVERVVEIWEELQASGKAHVGHVVVDAIGMGSGVLDRLQETRVTMSRRVGSTRSGRPKRRSTKVEGFDARKSARHTERFRNLRSQAWWEIRDRLEEGELFLPNDPELAEELSRAPYRVDESGKVWIRKDDLKTRIGRSPDRADAVAISLFPELEDPTKKKFWIGR